MKKKISLAEAKEKLCTEKVFLNGNSFNFVDVGKYKSGFTFIIPQEWTMDREGNPENPVKYFQTPEFTDNMNIDFDGTTYVLFGVYRQSQTGKPVFRITEPANAQDVLIRVSWGGSSNSSRGNTPYDAESIGAKFFKRASSNGGGCGCDYWVLPVNFCYNAADQDVESTLVEITENEKKRVEENERKYLEKEEFRIASIEKGKAIIPECKELVEQIQKMLEKYGETFSCTFEEEYMCAGYWREKYSYMEAQEYLLNILKDTKNKILHRETYSDVLNQISEDVEALGGIFCYTDINKVSIEFHDSFERNFKCDSIERIKEIQEYVNAERSKQEEEKALLIENMIKAKKERELQEKKKAAKEAGCPEIFSYWNRVGGATGQSHAYVIRPDGSIRTPDNNILNNYNHRHQHNWLENADGEQVYDQILIGELIIAYTKDCTKTPINVFVKWVPESTTEAQKETVNNIYNDLQCLYDNPKFVNEYGDVILSGYEWLTRK